MLQINITGSNPGDGSLEFDVNGIPNHGNSSIHRGTDVHWKVATGSGVQYINDIKMKTGNGAPPSIDIFAGNPPSSQGGAHSTHWKGIVSSSAPNFAIYNYDIEWMPDGGGGLKTCDPKLSILPSASYYVARVVAVVVAVLSIFSIFLFFLDKKKSVNDFAGNLPGKLADKIKSKMS